MCFQVVIMTRRTRQKSVIQAVIENAGRPVSPQEVLAAAKPSVPLLSLGTVYRVIKGLAAEGAIASVTVPGEGDRYEPHSKAAHHHHHFQCNSCRRVYDIPGCGLRVEPHLPQGFSVSRHEVMLYGSCGSCAVDV